MLGVLDGAVLVVSAVEGVQAQTRVLMRTLQRLRIPTLLFVNKVDRAGADAERVLRDIAERLTPAVVAMGSVHGLGTRDARFVLGAGDDAFAGWPTCWPTTTTRSWPPTSTTRRPPLPAAPRALAAQTAAGRWSTRCSSARRSPAPGVEALVAGITELLPARRRRRRRPGLGHRVQGRARPGRREGRLRRGCSRARSGCGTACPSAGTADEGKVTAISVFEHGAAAGAPSVAAGRDRQALGAGRGPDRRQRSAGRRRRAAGHQFAPPTLETVVVPGRPADRGALHVALAQLAEQDPLINLRQDDLRQEISRVALRRGPEGGDRGHARRRVRPGGRASARRPRSASSGRPAPGRRSSCIGKGPNPFLATVGLRVDPAPAGGGVSSGSRSSSARCRTRSSRPSRRP